MLMNFRALRQPRTIATVTHHCLFLLLRSLPTFSNSTVTLPICTTYAALKYKGRLSSHTNTAASIPAKPNPKSPSPVVEMAPLEGDFVLVGVGEVELVLEGG